jgi:hypothetical protein
VDTPRFQTREILSLLDFSAMSAALLLRRRGGRLAKVMRRVTAWTIAVLLWIFAALCLLGGLFPDRAGILSGVGGASEPMVRVGAAVVLGMLGWWFAGRWDGGLGKFSPRKAWDHYADKGRAITYDFYDDGYVQSVGGTGPHASYAEILALAEDDGHFYLLTSPRTAHIIGKNSFQIGEATDFAAFITAKIEANSQS